MEPEKKPEVKEGRKLKKFGSSTNVDEVIKGVTMTDKIVVITGGNSGIGELTVQAFAEMGAHVYMLCRDVAKAEKVRDAIRKKTKNEHVHVIALDLASFESIRACAKVWEEKGLPIHVLINNAGVMALPHYRTTKDGIEMQFGVNHLGHFLLTQKLLPFVKLGAPSRIVNVSSTAHAMYTFKIDEVNNEKAYDTFNGDWKAYSYSKAANVLFSNELNRRLALQEEGVAVTSNALHPGVIPTDLTRSMGYFSSFVFQVGAFVAGKNESQGAATTVLLGSAPELEGVGGRYFADCQYAYTHGSITKENATALWQLSEKLTEGQ